MKREYWRYLPFIFPYLRRYKHFVALSYVFMILGALLAVIQPWPLAFLVDGVLRGGSHNGLVQAVIHLFGNNTERLIIVAVLFGLVVTLGTGLVGLGNEYVNTRLALRVALECRSDLFRHCQKLSQTFYDHKRAGDFMYRINYEASSAGNLAVAVPPLVESILTLVGMFVVALQIDPLLAVLSLVVIPFIYYSTGFYGNRIEPRLRHVIGLEGTSLAIVNEAMSMLRIIVAFNRQPHEYRRFRTQSETATSARVKVTVAQTLFSLAVTACTTIGTALVLYVGAHHVLTHKLTIGELLILLSYIASIYKPLESISSTLAQLQVDLIGVSMAKSLLETEPEIQDLPHARALERAQGRVTFEGVSFGYDGRERALKQVSFDVSPGELIAVVGPTGAGKTTLMSLIPRFYAAQEGRILIDGVDVRDVTLESLRDNISIVPQEPLLFSDTIANNIRYGRLEAELEDIVSAAQAANAHDFIVQLPQGYDTELGERGSTLSGGERQRICIARAFLKDAPVVILDEPTSSIDSKTESIILDAIDKLMIGRTTFLIAHRFSTVRSCSRVLVMSEGKLVQEGTREQLLRSDGLYRQLSDLQSTAPSEPAEQVPPEQVDGSDLADTADSTSLDGGSQQGIDTWLLLVSGGYGATADVREEDGTLS